jgi:predicted DNA repair protein MutK
MAASTRAGIVGDDLWVRGSRHHCVSMDRHLGMLSRDVRPRALSQND